MKFIGVCLAIVIGLFIMIISIPYYEETPFKEIGMGINFAVRNAFAYVCGSSFYDWYKSKLKQ